MDNQFKATKELLLFVVSLIKAIIISAEDGLSITDAFTFIKPALLSLDVFKDIDQLQVELQNFKADQIQELTDIVNANLSQTDKTDQIIKKSLDIGLKVFDLYSYIKKPESISK